MNATVVFVFNFKMLPPGQAHCTPLQSHSIIDPYQKENDLYWSLEPDGVTMPHLGQPIPNLNM